MDKSCIKGRIPIVAITLMSIMVLSFKRNLFSHFITGDYQILGNNGTHSIHQNATFNPMEMDGITLQDLLPNVPEWNESCLSLKFANLSFPKTALASFPGSGNTWSRHLIQQLTGEIPSYSATYR